MYCCCCYCVVVSLPPNVSILIACSGSLFLWKEMFCFVASFFFFEKYSHSSHSPLQLSLAATNPETNALLCTLKVPDECIAIVLSFDCSSLTVRCYCCCCLFVIFLLVACLFLFVCFLLLFLLMMYFCGVVGLLPLTIVCCSFAVPFSYKTVFTFNRKTKGTPLSTSLRCFAHPWLSWGCQCSCMRLNSSL